MIVRSKGAEGPSSDHVPSLGFRHRWTIYTYLGGLLGLITLCDPTSGLIDVPLSFILKNQLRMDASEVAQFKLVAGIPLYFSICFGFIRDRWSPFDGGDRAYLIVFSLVSTSIYVFFSIVPVSATGLLFASVLMTCSSLFLASALNGLCATIGRRYDMTGQISASWNISTAAFAMTVFIAGGFISQALNEATLEIATRRLFLIGAALSLVLAGFAGFRPPTVFENRQSPRRANASVSSEIQRLLSHRPIYPALLIWLIWNFSPGSVTALQFYLQNTLGAQDWQWGIWNATFAASFIPTSILYGFLCRRCSLNRLLWWATIIAIPQFLPLLFVQSASAAILLAVPMGLMGGFATAAYLDFIFRSAPPGLEGTMLMAASTMYFIATRLGDVLGSVFFRSFDSFGACALLTTICYVLILPVLRKCP